MEDDFAGEIFFPHWLRNSYGDIIDYLGNTTFNSNKISKNNDGRILIIDAEIADDAFALIRLYNPNTEAEELQKSFQVWPVTWRLLSDSTQNIVFARDFNLCFELMLHISG